MSDMEPKEPLENTVECGAVPDGSSIQDVEPVQMSTEAEDDPEVIELAGQVKEALAPVRAPSSVRDKLRVELVEVAQHRQCQDVRVESPSRRREWAIGAAIGSAVALVSGVLYLLRSRMQEPSRPDNKSQSADGR
jgi:hypothetical protein